MKKTLYSIGLLSILFIISCSFINFQQENTYHFDNNTYKMLDEMLQEKKIMTTYNEIINWANDIKSIFLDNGKDKELIHFFGELAEKEEKSDIKDLLYFIISDFIWEIGNKDVAVFYMLKINENIYPVEYNYNPIGYYIAKRIINSETSNKIKEKMYNLLLTNYKNIIDIPYTLLEFSKLYKEELEINKSVKIMQEILKYPIINEDIEETINIDYIKSEINFNNYQKNWIYQDLETLIINIKNAIEKQDKVLLDSFVSKNDFTIKLFEKENKRRWTYYELKVHDKWSSRISFSPKLEEFSNNNEAFLKTSNWNFIDMRVWYLYFKKVNYPYDIKVNNGWEWAGILLGNPY